MKTKVYFLLICVFAFATTSVVNCANLKGSGKTVTNTVNISDYDSVELSGSCNFEYEQSDAAPFLSVTIDDNLFEYVNVEVSNGKLKIGFKRDGLKNLNLRPTVFQVKSNSKDLKNLKLSGSGNFTSRKPLSTNSFSCSISGSGNAVFGDINVSSLSCNISGSGNMNLRGNAKSAEYSISGSGKIKASECKADKVNVTVFGSGNSEVYASSELDIKVSGSGNVKYNGNPLVNSKTTGSGKVSHY